MQKWMGWILAALMLLAGVAFADEAVDITRYSRMKPNQNWGDLKRLRDGRIKTYWNGGKNAWIEFELPETRPCYGMYIRWAEEMMNFVVEKPGKDGEWEVCVPEPEHLFYNQYVPLEGLTRFRLRKTDPREENMAIGELQLLSEGDLPDFVQIWKPFEGKADLLVLVAHPDDEVLWFGGMIPYYRGELGKKVLVVSVSRQPGSRKSELLDCLWTCGVREYPIVTGGEAFIDRYSSYLKEVLEMWGEDNLLTFVARILREYQPDVVATHDFNGEYGHAAHKACAYAVEQCLELASDAQFDPDSARKYGTWKPKKVYVHLYPENQIIMDWRQPLEAFGGKTGFDMACLGFKRHKTQQSGKYAVQDKGRKDCRKFGLLYTSVGADVQGNDLFENIPGHSIKPALEADAGEETTASPEEADRKQ